MRADTPTTESPLTPESPNATLTPVRVRVSVRDFVEFVTRSGDIDNRSAGRDADAMAEGARMHRKIQKAQPAGYRAEVSLQHEEILTYEGRVFATSSFPKDCELLTTTTTLMSAASACSLAVFS